MWTILSLTCCVIGVVYSDCPLMKKSLEYGKQHFNYLSQQHQTLTSEGYTLFEGPGTLFFQSSATEPQESVLVNKSSSLVFASQFYYDLSLAQSYAPQTKLQRIQELNNLSSCLPQEDRCTVITDKCDPSAKFANLNGRCVANLDNPIWASQSSSYYRLASANYYDGIHEIAKSSVTNEPLPAPRLIGNKAIKKTTITSLPKRVANYGGMIYGQTIAHDFGKRNAYQNPQGGNGYRCCSLDSSQKLPDSLSHYGCAAIIIPNNDPILKYQNIGCLNMIRSETTLPNDCVIGAAQKQNLATGLLDLSHVYGSNNDENVPLRSFKLGQLNITNEVLPLTTNCFAPGFCYTNGDTRAVFQPTLGLMHSLFYRFHNSIATQLHASHSDWDDNRLFFETRRILIGVHQHFTYDEWLPMFLGDDYLQQKKINCADSLYCGVYNSTFDPSPSNEFAQGAFRLVHEFVPTMFYAYNADYSVKSSYNISELVTSLSILDKQYDDWLRGLLLVPVQFDSYSPTLRNNAFQFADAINSTLGIDLLSVDITVSRDHGLQPYYYFKDVLLGTTTTQWSDLEATLSKDSIDSLKKLYESVFDVDLHVGMLLEQRSGDYFGQVGKFIIGEQFYRAKYGNRFFYTFENGPYPFTKAQLKEIKRYTLANFYCEFSDIVEVQPRAMEVQNNLDNAFKNCKKYKPFDVTAF